MSRNKRDQENKTPRDHWIVGHSSELVSELTVTYDPITGTPSIKELDPASLRSQVSHPRDNGKDKIISSIPVDGFDYLNGDFLARMQRQFDYVIAVDTNTSKERIDGLKVSACLICCIAEPLVKIKDQIKYEHLAAYLILDTGNEGNAERIGWHLVTTVHLNTPYLKGKRIGIVTDSELGEHIDINARTKPYYQEHFLPANMSLVYARDKGDNFTNKMIQMNDTNGRHFMKFVKEKGLSALPLGEGLQMGTARCYYVGSAKKNNRVHT
ncbi:hypothetical protein LOY37_04060 [Pseudomonas sp. B21-012]|uniref:hypothetical protein n=1 Tax=Pseudomonas sp. B21-012 TaxID=2895472 RepID=UPI00215E16D0|nr:hypothetical protein [Pseudomonas sp. B21-012]UVM56765.1 hypothetical protein LOY37_04060 [Pseudomonas sp. B21-012]